MGINVGVHGDDWEWLGEVRSVVGMVQQMVRNRVG